MDYIIIFLESIVAIISAPLLTGILRKIKSFLRGYTGASIFQPYYDLIKLYQKTSIRSTNSSFITEIGPVISLAAMITICILIPFFYVPQNSGGSNLWLIVFLMMIFKFFQVLIGLDSGSAFGNMGSSRELFIGMLAEPVIFLVAFFIYHQTGTFDLFLIPEHYVHHSWSSLSWLLAAGALFLLILIENSRMPIDNPETHLELTMIHEGMLLDLSGRDLAMMLLAAQLKLMVFMTLLLVLFFPGSIALELNWIQYINSIVMYILKVLVLLFMIALLEVLTAKSRLFRSPEWVAFAFSIMIAAISIGLFSHY